LREITIPPEDIGAAQRIAVRHRVSLANLLPARQRAVLERIPGVEAITPLTFFGGRYKEDEGVGFAQFAMDPAQLTNVFGEAKLPLEQLTAWIADRSSCVVGRDTFERYKMRLGDKVFLEGTIWPCDLELKLVGVFEGTADDRNLFFHQKYLDEAAGNLGLVGTWWVRARSLEVVPEVIERAFQLSFIAMFGNIKVLVGSICSVVVFTLALVTGSTMSMAVRERFRELAILKALGYRRREIFAFILAESFGLAMAGAVLGVGGAWWFYGTFSISKLTQGIFILFEVTPKIVCQGFLVAAALGIAASVAPAIAVARQSVVDGLKTLD
jgi:putative ABC transport system permease protein